ncbi:MAG: TIGR02266 family protein [Nitrospira sp.]|nr:TIGR02266 family protein [Nitrospira sp.]
MNMKKTEPGDRLRLPVALTEAHKGKVLEVDREQEMFTLVDSDGDVLGTVHWATVIEWIQALNRKVHPVESRTHRRVSVLIRVQYRTPEGGKIDGRASGVSGGGLFIESTAPFPVGTKIALSFSLPNRQTEWLEAKGVVAWVCPKADQYTLFPGMGVKFTEISDKVRNRVVELIGSLQKPGLPPSGPSATER